MRSSKVIDLFTIAATVVGLIVDLSAVYSWTGSGGSCLLGTSDKQGLLWTIFSFYSLASVSFYSRRLLYKYKAEQSQARMESNRSRFPTQDKENPIPIFMPLTDGQKRDIDIAEFSITCLSAVVFLLPPILTVDWEALQFNIYYYTYFLYPPYLSLIIMFILLLVLIPSMLSRQLYNSILGHD